MRNLTTTFLTAAFGLAAGCSTIHTQHDVKYDVPPYGAPLSTNDVVYSLPQPFSGTQENLIYWKLIFTGDPDAWSFVYWGPAAWIGKPIGEALDLPASLILDAALLPYTIIKQNKVGNVTVPKRSLRFIGI